MLCYLSHSPTSIQHLVIPFHATSIKIETTRTRTMIHDWCIHTVRTWCTWRRYHPVQRIAKKARIDSIRLILKCCSWWERKVWERVRCWEWGWCDVTHTVHYATHGKIYRTIVIWERYFDLPTHTGRRYFPWCASNVYHVHVLIFLSFPVCCPALPFTPSL